MKINQIPSNSADQPIYFLNLYPRLVYVYYIITGGLYGLFWFYKQWRAVKVARRPTIMPLWRSLFVLFFILQLFDTISNENVRRRDSKLYLPTATAFLYMIPAIFLNIIASREFSGIVITISYLVLTSASACALALTQRTINSFQLQSSDENEVTSYGQTFIVVIGIVLTLMALLSGFIVPSGV